MNVKDKIKKIRKTETFRKALSFIFPERCPYCGKLVEADEIACESCKKELLDTLSPIRCGVYGCRCVSAFRYENQPRKAILNLKNYDKPQYARQLAAVMARCIREEFGDVDFDMITFVPMYRKDERDREFNQSKILALELSKLLEISCVATLEKIKHTKKQHHLSASQRRKNLSGAFRLIDKEILSKKKILMVDDIVTTKTTLSECAKVLNRSSPELICFSTFANAALDERLPDPIS